MPILWMRKLRNREIKWLSQGYTDKRQPSQTLNQGNLASESKLPTAVLCSKIFMWISRPMRTNVRCKTKGNARIPKLQLSKEESSDLSGVRSGICPRLPFHHILSFSLHILARWRRALYADTKGLFWFPQTTSSSSDSVGRGGTNTQLYHFLI